MNYLLLYGLISVMMIVTARHKKHKKGFSRDNKEGISTENSTEINNHIDMTGNLKKQFFVLCALSRPDENSVCSPMSALMPLGKLALGAEDQCLQELLTAIGVAKKHKIRHHFKPLLIELRYLPGGKLDIASKLYVSIDSHLYRPFVDQSRDIFDSSLEKLDFQYPTYAAEQINSWVSSQTNYIIKDMISPIDIPPLCSMVLVNAVYFSGRWKEAFDKLENGTFYAPKGKKNVLMMTNTGYYNYTRSESLNSYIIKIPYMGEKASFVIVLPTTRNGLPILLSQLKLAPELLDWAMDRMVNTNVEITMPKFKIGSQFNLRELYEKVDVKEIFKNYNSGLTKIIKDANLHVTSAKQKVFIEVNQFGTEAAASSSLIITKLALHKPETFLVDHPFLFFVLMNRQQLFSGTLVDPD